MAHTPPISRTIKFLAFSSLLVASSLLAQSSQPKAAAIKAAVAPKQGEFFIHAFHKDKLGGSLECSACHVPVKDGAVALKRPGHDQCMTCHSDDFNKDLKQVICAQCHTTFPPSSHDDLVAFPRYKGSRAILFEFSHAKHVDQKARIDAKTGFRADCTYCHKFEPQGIFATFPGHDQCAGCHAKPGMKPQLKADMDEASCRGCHTPEEVENPGYTSDRRFIASHVVSGKYVNISFSHVAHFKVKDQWDIKCTTCHYAIPESTSLKTLTLPKMIDCVQCHDSSRAIKADFRMSNCKTCHQETVSNLVTPASHTRNVKPDFHNEAFRPHHEKEASAADAKCFVCHQNVTPSLESKDQCVNCHQVMKPANHTARWKDQLHGKFAGIDRENCATCHAASYCSDCHNVQPRSHVPLAPFKAGAHAVAATLDLRSCLTCHTFQNTCSECHTNKLGMQVLPRNMPDDPRSHAAKPVMAANPEGNKDEPWYRRLLQ